MNPDELRALADALERIVPHIEDILHSAPDDLERAAAFLRQRAEQRPVAWSDGLGSFIAADEKVGDDPDILAYRVPLYTHPAPAVPAGWKPVPVEPTGLMVDAGREAMQHAPDLGGIVSANTAEVMDSYRAMLAAAPAVPQAEPIDPHMIVAEDRFPDEQAEPKREPNPDEVICPACTHQFRAIPENVQAQLWAKREPLSDEQIDTALQTYPATLLALMGGEMTVGEFKSALRRLARTVEHAHGISGGGHD